MRGCSRRQPVFQHSRLDQWLLAKSPRCRHPGKVYFCYSLWPLEMEGGAIWTDFSPCSLSTPDGTSPPWTSRENTSIVPRWRDCDLPRFRQSPRDVKKCFQSSNQVRASARRGPLGKPRIEREWCSHRPGESRSNLKMRAPLSPLSTWNPCRHSWKLVATTGSMY